MNIFTIGAIVAILALIVWIVANLLPVGKPPGAQLVKGYTTAQVTTTAFVSADPTVPVGDIVSMAKWYSTGQPNADLNDTTVYYFFVTQPKQGTVSTNTLWMISGNNLVGKSPTLVPVDVSKLQGTTLTPGFVSAFNPQPGADYPGNKIQFSKKLICVLDKSGNSACVLDASQMAQAVNSSPTSVLAVLAGASDMATLYPVPPNPGTFTPSAILDWSQNSNATALNSLVITDFGSFYGISADGTKLYQLIFTFNLTYSGLNINFVDILGLGSDTFGSSSGTPASLTNPVNNLALPSQTSQYYALFTTTTSAATLGQLCRIDNIKNVGNPVKYLGSGSLTPMTAMTENAINQDLTGTVTQLTNAFYASDGTFVYTVNIVFN